MMSSGGLRPRRSNGRRQEPIAISTAVVVLALTALVCAGLVAVPLWTALVQSLQVEEISDPCDLKDATALQDCLEKLRLGGHPAEVANAPIRLHPRQEKID